MEQVELLHSTATAVDVRTAEQLGPYNSNVYRLGKLLITSTSLKDSGLRGTKGSCLERHSDHSKHHVQNADASPVVSRKPTRTSANTQAKKKTAGSSQHAACPGISGNALMGPFPASTNGLSSGSATSISPGPCMPSSAPAPSAPAATNTQEVQPSIYQDPAVLRAAPMQKANDTKHVPGAQHAHSAVLLPHVLQPQPQPKISVQSLVHAVNALIAHGYDIPKVWAAMGIEMTPEKVKCADIIAAAQTAGAPADLLHHLLQPAPSKAAAISCSALEQHMQGLSLAGQQQQQHAAHGASCNPRLQPGNAQPVPCLGQQPQDSNYMHHPLAHGSTAQPATAGPQMDSPWQQELDPASGCYYYFNFTAGLTQWEPPAEGYRPRMLHSGALEQGLLHSNSQQQQQQQQQPHHLQLQVHHQHQHQQTLHSQPLPQQPQHAAFSLSQVKRAVPGDTEVHAHGMHVYAGIAGTPEIQVPQPASASSAQRTWQQEELMQDLPDDSLCQQELQTMLDTDRNVLPRHMAKYWLQRYSLFSKYDDGIDMDTEGWYSVTPEVLALHQAQMCKLYGNGHLVMDAMAGCGGNVIQMAMVFPQVMGVEISERRCSMMAHNAVVYNVLHRVNLLCCDFFAAAPQLLADAIFVSPPWGGPTYQYSDSFDVLSSTIDGQTSVRDLLVACMNVVDRTWRRRGSVGQRSSVALQPRLVLAPDGEDALSASVNGVPVSNGTAGSPAAPSQATQQLLGCSYGLSNGACEARPLHGVVQPSSNSSRMGMGVVALFLPRNSDLAQLESLVPEGSVWHAERNFVNGKLKGMTIYCFGSRE